MHCERFGGCCICNVVHGGDGAGSVPSSTENELPRRETGIWPAVWLRRRRQHAHVAKGMWSCTGCSSWRGAACAPSVRPIGSRSVLCNSFFKRLALLLIVHKTVHLGATLLLTSYCLYMWNCVAAEHKVSAPWQDWLCPATTMCWHCTSAPWDPR